MAMMRRDWLLGTASTLLCAGGSANAQPPPMGYVLTILLKPSLSLWLSERSTAADKTVSVVAEATAGDEVVGLAIDILPDWKAVSPGEKGPLYSGEVRLRSLGARSDALVRYLAKPGRPNESGAAMVAQRTLQLTGGERPSDLEKLKVRGSTGPTGFRNGIWIFVSWPDRAFGIGAESPQMLLDVLMRPV